ncbi:MAG: capsular polysaccharide synthesis protein [Chitinophagales bacterium]|nr:capsular polysaccharide synthesis protein [Chitinophagales bacterium]MCO5247750.1 capsular polysaccharide synthesis protein [Chitinophagales bacterium]
MDTRNTVHGLWIKGELSSMEKLTILSFLKHGYHFILWTYDDFTHYSYIAGLEVKDAREIIPENQVFKYKYPNQFGHGQGSYAGFSDIFRYRLLYLYGGWWVDMDVTCLKQFKLDTPYVFRKSKEDENYIVGNIMHVPQGSSLMKKCYEEAKDSVNADNSDWMLPINILNKHIHEENLTQYVYTFSNEDRWTTVCPLLLHSVYPETWSAIHWMNEEFRTLNISKEHFISDSVLGQLYQEAELGFAISDFKSKIKYRIKASSIFYMLKYVGRVIRSRTK